MSCEFRQLRSGDYSGQLVVLAREMLIEVDGA